VSIFYQHFWELALLEKIGPEAFFPPPKVYSRLFSFRVRAQQPVISQEAQFWSFIKACFHQPRRTLKNNLASYQYALSAIPEDILALRAQQISPEQFYALWHRVLAAAD
jgi:16S rRNA (adenine1518-N6/adenine1519-N6)-dimethyltransferase